MGGETCPVVGTKIQTSCNFKANLRDRYCHLGCVHSLFSNAILEIHDNLMVRYHRNISVSSNLELLLHKDFPHPPSSSKSSTRPRSTTEPNKSTEHSAIQKGIVHCNMATTDFGRLLSTLLCSEGWQTISNYSWAWELYANFNFLKLVIKPDSLLLEDRRSQTSSKGHYQTYALPLFFELDDPAQMYDKTIKYS